MCCMCMYVCMCGGGGGGSGGGGGVCVPVHVGSLNLRFAVICSPPLRKTAISRPDLWIPQRFYSHLR